MRIYTFFFLAFVGSGMACYAMEAPLPPVFQAHQPDQGGQQGVHIALPSPEAVDRHKKIRDFFSNLKEDWPSPTAVKNKLEADPWLLNERDPSPYNERKTAVCVIASEWLNRLENFDNTYHWVNGDLVPVEQDYDCAHQRDIFKHLLSRGKNDAEFLRMRGELKSLLEREQASCGVLIDYYKRYFPQDHFGTSFNDDIDEAEIDVFAYLNTVHAAQQNNQGVRQLTEDKKAALVWDIFATIEPGDSAKAKKLIAADPWLVNAYMDDKPLLYQVAENCGERNWYSQEQQGLFQKRQALFALLLLKGADPLKAEGVNTRDYYHPTTRSLISGNEYPSANYDRVKTILDEYDRDPQLLLQRFPELDDTPRVVGPPSASADAAQPQQRAQARTAAGRRRPRPSFWSTWKPWIGGAGLVAFSAGAWYLKNKYWAKVDPIDSDDSDDDFDMD